MRDSARNYSTQSHVLAPHNSTESGRGPADDDDAALEEVRL